jgi:hypothetical protein
MNTITPDQFQQVMRQAGVKPKFYKDVRLSQLSTINWQQCEFVALQQRNITLCDTLGLNGVVMSHE